MGFQGERCSPPLRPPGLSLSHPPHPFFPAPPPLSQVPKELRVGTLDALMALSDDLVKIDMFFENTTTKIARSLVDLSPSDSQLTVNGANIEQFVTNFSWEEARYPTKNSLRELVRLLRRASGSTAPVRLAIALFSPSSFLFFCFHRTP